MYTVIVKIEVVNSEGEVVDHRGYPDNGRRRDAHSPLATEQRFGTYDSIEKAHRTLNGVHTIVDRVADLP